jgi:GT2 family glycosyltransferase
MTVAIADITGQGGTIEPVVAAATRARPQIRTAVGIASARRPAVLRKTVDYLTSLENRPERIFVCVPDSEDAAGLADCPGVELMLAPRGLTCQRNRILQVAARYADVLVFLDDDFIPAPHFIPRMEEVFAQEPNVMIATGEVLADGILCGGLTLTDALEVIATAAERPAIVADTYNAYGCNMVIRLSSVVQHRLAFDEQLPLHGWLEDVDFSRTMARHGRSVRVEGARGVHLGVKSGRQPGLRLGYSQIANPAYLIRKGTMSKTRAFAQISRNITANAFGTLFGDGTIDRWGRVAGNIIALTDLLRGRAHPSKILKLDNLSLREMLLSPRETRRR